MDIKTPDVEDPKTDWLNHSFETEVQQEYLLPSYRRDIIEFITNREHYRHAGFYLEIIGKILLNASVLAGVVCSGLKVENGTIITTSICSCAALFQNLGSHLLKLSKENTEQLKQTIDQLKINGVVVDVISEKSTEIAVAVPINQP